MRRALALLPILFLTSCSQAEWLEQSRWLMGTELRIVLPEGGESAAQFEEAFEIAARWERILSRWDPEAELARWNAAAGGEANVSPELFGWLQRCARDAELTEGAFDPSVGTWILDPESDVEIGMERILLNQDTQTALLPEGMALDSGGDGKGVAVDAIVAYLREAGVSDALISFGGSSSYGLGGGPEGDGWKLAVMDVHGEWAGTAVLKDAALSISHSVQVDQLGDGATEERYHIYDPATGELVREARSSVVHSSSGTEAEVLSTALIVRGETGLELLANYPGCAAVLLPGPSVEADWWIAEN